MFDNAPLEQEDLIDQCRALAYALVELDHPEAKNILTFILSERLDSLYCSGQQKLATALEFFQYRFSDSFGGNPPLYS